ncbi:uncharacterized protein [Periplaneta americana]|uniref:uncharacterized protein isoform X2 n=1 Tax=Periplaneta americana TaxID=6978 RepID=UPI0037E8ACB8
MNWPEAYEQQSTEIEHLTPAQWYDSNGEYIYPTMVNEEEYETTNDTEEDNGNYWVIRNFRISTIHVIIALTGVCLLLIICIISFLCFRMKKRRSNTMEMRKAAYSNRVDSITPINKEKADANTGALVAVDHTYSSGLDEARQSESNGETPQSFRPRLQPTRNLVTVTVRV